MLTVKQVSIKYHFLSLWLTPPRIESRSPGPLYSLGQWTDSCHYWPNELSVRQRSRSPEFNPRSSHTKDSKMVLDSVLLNTQHYKVGIKVKWCNPEKGVVRSPAPRCRRYWEECLRVTFDYTCQRSATTYFYLIIVIFLLLITWFQVFLSKSYNYMISSNYFYFIIILSLHAVI